MNSIDIQTAGFVILLLMFVSLFTAGEDAIHDGIESAQTEMILAAFNDSNTYNTTLRTLAQ